MWNVYTLICFCCLLKNIYMFMLKWNHDVSLFHCIPEFFESLVIPDETRRVIVDSNTWWLEWSSLVLPGETRPWPQHRQQDSQPAPHSGPELHRCEPDCQSQLCGCADTDNYCSSPTLKLSHKSSFDATAAVTAVHCSELLDIDFKVRTENCELYRCTITA